MITRAVPLDEEQYLLLEDLGKAAMRAKDHELATKLLAIALAWKVAPIVRFGCDIDEFAGMAEVVELQGYSKKVPCA